MALKAKLTIIGHDVEYSVVECEYKLTQNSNVFGMPTSGVEGGKIIVTLASPEKSNFLHEWMLRDNLKYDGIIKLDVNYNRYSKNGTRIIRFNDAYCIELYEYFNNQNSDMMTMRLTLSASDIIFFDSPNGRSIGLSNKFHSII